MKVICCSLALATGLLGQQASPVIRSLDFRLFQRSCVPEAPMSTLMALIRTESNGNPYALAVDYPNALLRRWKLPTGTLRLARQPNDAREAQEWIHYFDGFAVSVDVGLLQVSTAEAKRRGIPVARLLDPCSNLRVGWSILNDFYRRETQQYGPGQTSLVHALSRYNTGDAQREIDNGYLNRVLSSLRALPTEEQQR